MPYIPAKICSGQDSAHQRRKSSQSAHNRFGQINFNLFKFQLMAGFF